MCSHLPRTSPVVLHVALFHSIASSTKMAHELECDKLSSDEPWRSNESRDLRASVHKPCQVGVSFLQIILRMQSVGETWRSKLLTSDYERWQKVVHGSLYTRATYYTSWRPLGHMNNNNIVYSTLAYPPSSRQWHFISTMSIFAYKNIEPNTTATTSMMLQLTKGLHSKVEVETSCQSNDTRVVVDPELSSKPWNVHGTMYQLCTRQILEFLSFSFTAKALIVSRPSNFNFTGLVYGIPLSLHQCAFFMSNHGFEMALNKVLHAPI